CMEIWDRYETIPSMEQVKIAWASLCEQIFPYIKEDVKGLSPNQKRVLKYLSQYPFGKTLDQTLLVEIGIRNYSSAKQALEYLKTKDLIYYSLKDNQYHIYDPLLRKYLR
ncbi:hypothetical protein, partial [Fangia hongkongensis]